MKKLLSIYYIINVKNTKKYALKTTKSTKL